MTFKELQDRVIQELRERSTPKYWTMAEIKEKINRGMRELCDKTEAQVVTVPLVVADPTTGRHYFPQDVLRIKQSYWNGYPIDQQSRDYLDSLNFGTGRIPGIRGDDMQVSATTPQWNTITGDPTCWFLDEGQAVLYPIPSALSTAAATRQKDEGILPAGQTVITLTQNAVVNKNQINIFIDGAYQHLSSFSILAPNQVQLTGSLSIDVGYEVVYIPSGGTTSLVPFKYLFSLPAGTAKINLPRAYVRNSNAISYTIDGMTQSPSTITELTSYSFGIPALVVAAEIEVTVYQAVSAVNFSMRYVKSPAVMVNDLDIPDFPAGMDQFHDAAWMWAVFECLGREGETQDIAKADRYRAMFLGRVADWKRAFSPPILIRPDNPPWRV